ncbi:MAG: GrpB family protein [Actinomycetota bacterium]|nr:GrpB family protein [Actinomycetota bacterium]
MISVVEYDPTWPAQFEELRSRYRRALDGVPVVAIEHVGSTSVEGLAAKPVIDIDIVVTAEHVAAASDALAAIGFEPMGELGIAQRWAFRQPDGLTRTNTYVTVDGCVSLRNHLAVRDVLRTDPELRAEYGALKQRLGTELDDIGAYVEAKSPVLQRVLERAGFSADELAGIDDANRAP